MKQLTINFNLREAGVGVVAMWNVDLKLHGAYREQADRPVTWAALSNFKVHSISFVKAEDAFDYSTDQSIEVTNELQQAVVDWMDRRLDEGEYSHEIQDIADTAMAELAVCDE